jgi:hypothetical protein
VTLSITGTQHNSALHYSECHYAECRVLFNIVIFIKQRISKKNFYELFSLSLCQGW